MNGKQAKFLRSLAKDTASIGGNELVEVEGTKRVRTAANGTKVQTVTLAHKRGSFRNELKAWKSRVYSDLFNPATNNHKPLEA